MPSKKHHIHVLPEKIDIPVAPGVIIRDALLANGIFLDDYCGGKANCGKCKIRFPQNAPPPTPADKKFLTEPEIKNGIRLACVAKVTQNTTIIIPERSRRNQTRIVLADLSQDITPDSELKKIKIKLEPASLERQLSDLDLIRSALKRETLSVDMECLMKLPSVLRESDYSVTLTLFNDVLVDVQPGDHTIKAGRGAFGISFDLGTTTIAGALFQLDTGKTLDRRGTLNPQTAYGADVISRIQFASQSVKNKTALQENALKCLNEIMEELCKNSGVKKKEIAYITLAGNTTMQHLLLGIPADNLPVAPYVRVYTDGLLLSAKNLELDVHPGARIYVFPSIGGFVGGDTVADLLTADICGSDKLCLMIDIGTNGEIVLGNKKRVLATSAAAGPAFEGRNISCGMYAENGAVDRVIIGEDIRVHTLGESAARGLCGSGLVSLVSELLKAGLIDPSGRFDPSGGKSDVPENISARFEKTDNGLKFAFALKSQGAEKDLFLLQKDIRQLQLAKGAIAAGLTLLLKEYGADIGDIGTIYLAGAFGNYIAPSDAIRLGLLPGADEEKVCSLGNAALTGASLALLQKASRDKADRIAKKVEFIELAGRSDFQDTFALSMMF